MRTWLLPLALLLPAPAGADWPRGHWDMGAEQLLAAVADAKPTKASRNTSMMNLDRLATAPVVDGDVKLNADFYFARDTHKLRVIDLLPTKTQQCPAYRERLVARLGAGKLTEVRRPILDKTLATVSIEWTDAASDDRLEFKGMIIGDSRYAICRLRQTPAGEPG